MDEEVWVAACLAENVIEDKAGVLSIIRIVDTFNVWAEIIVQDEGSDEKRSQAVPPVVAAQLVAILKKVEGGTTTHEVGLVLRAPDGTVRAEAKNKLELSAERGAQVVSPVTFNAEAAGRYVFEVLVDDVIRARVPFLVNVQRPEEVPRFE